jgi:transcription termination factor Rho
MDEVIFEEFKGTGNMESHLDRHLVDRRIFPSINVELSGTRKEELLYHPDEYGKVVLLRKALTGVPAVEAMELLLSKLKRTGTNIEFLLSVVNS